MESSNFLDSNYHKISYDSTILIIDKKGKELESWDMLLTIDEFKNLYNHSFIYMENAVAFLSEKIFTIEQKNICVFSMQSLQIEDYIKFSQACLILYNKDKITELVLKNIISPNFLGRNNIAKNYKNPEVIRFLEILKDDVRISDELKKIAENILSGKYEKIQTLMKDNGGNTE